MKKITLLLFFITINLFAQNKFNYDENGLTEYVVVNMDSLTQEQLYQKSINWIKETYKSADDVIKMQIENEKVKINGFESSALMHKALGMEFYGDVRYTIEISFKNNKYRFRPLSLEVWSDASQYTSAGWSNISLTSGETYYKKNGKVRKMMSSYLTDIPAIFNRLNISLENYLLKNSGIIENTDEKW